MPGLTPDPKPRSPDAAGNDPIARAIAHALDWAAQVERLHGRGLIHGNIPTSASAKPSAGSSSAPSTIALGGIGRRARTPLPLRDLGPLKISRRLDAAARQLGELGIDLAPQQIDIFQLGVLLCTLLTGKPADDYLRSARVKQRVPAAIQPVLDRALITNRDDSFTHVAQFAAALRAAVGME
jgi:hypothetical protein